MNMTKVNPVWKSSVILYVHFVAFDFEYLLEYLFSILLRDVDFQMKIFVVQITQNSSTNPSWINPHL